MKNTIFRNMTLLIFLLFGTSALAGETEKWTGSFTNTDEKRYKVQYNVQLECEDEAISIQIEMLNLDLEPTPDYTYQLENITLVNDILNFSIPRKFDTRKCQLSMQENGAFEGSCISNKAASQTDKSQITAKPEGSLIASCEDASEEDESEENMTKDELVSNPYNASVFFGWRSLPK